MCAAKKIIRRILYQIHASHLLPFLHCVKRHGGYQYSHELDASDVNAFRLRVNKNLHFSTCHENLQRETFGICLHHLILDPKGEGGGGSSDID